MPTVRNGKHVKKAKLSTASEIIDYFGGTARMAEKLGVTMSAVSNWRRDGKRGHIPYRFHHQIYLELAKEKISIDPTLFSR